MGAADTTYYGWHDPDPKRPVRDKVLAGAARYLRRFGVAAARCCCHATDAAAISEPVPGLVIEAHRDVPRHNFYLTHLTHLPDSRSEASA